ncbi:hypothetical protein [Nocardiopsis flavescens]
MAITAWDERGRKVFDPTPRDVDTMVANLGGGNRFLIVDRDGDHYVQVWRFDGGGYELEYRDGGPHSHHRAFSDSSAEVATAMSGWLTAARDWREPLTWEDISHRFTGDGG